MTDWIVVLIAQAAFILGYLCGRVGRLTSIVKEEPKGFFAQKPVNKKRAADPAVFGSPLKIDIDERKIVSQINTDTLQKVTQTDLGAKTVVTDDINASVNRLAQLKGK